MAHERPDVDTAPALDGIQVLRNGLPGEVNPGPLRGQRHALHVVEHAQVPVPVPRSHRRNHRATLAHNDGGIAVERRGVDNWVPHRLGIKVGVMVNKPWGNDATLGVDGACGRVMALAHPHDLARVHRDVGVEGRLA